MINRLSLANIRPVHALFQSPSAIVAGTMIAMPDALLSGAAALVIATPFRELLGGPVTVWALTIGPIGAIIGAVAMAHDREAVSAHPSRIGKEAVL